MRTKRNEEKKNRPLLHFHYHHDARLQQPPFSAVSASSSSEYDYEPHERFGLLISWFNVMNHELSLPKTFRVSTRREAYLMF